MTKTKLEKFLGITMSQFMYTQITWHVRDHGPGAKVEAKMVKRVGINSFVLRLEKFVNYLVKVSIKTAEVQTKEYNGTSFTIPYPQPVGN